MKRMVYLGVWLVFGMTLLAACGQGGAPTQSPEEAVATVSALLTERAVSSPPALATVPPPTSPAMGEATAVPPTNTPPTALASPTPEVVAAQYLLSTLDGQAGEVLSLAYHSTGRLLAAGTHRGVQVWDRDTGTIVRTHTDAGDWVVGVAYSPDGRQLAAVAGDHLTWVWDAAGGQLIHSLQGEGGWLTSVAFSANTNFLTAGSLDTTIRVWKADSGEFVHTLGGHTAEINSIAFNASGARLISGSSDGTVRLYDPNVRTSLRIYGGGMARITSVAYSADGRMVGAGDVEGNMLIWDAETGRHVSRLSGHSGGITGIAFNPLDNGQTIVSSSKDGSVRIWDIASGQVQTTYTVEGNPAAYCVVFRPASRELAAGYSDGLVRIWQVP